MSEDLERRLRRTFRSDLPPAPTDLAVRLSRLPVDHPHVRRRWVSARGILAAAVVVTVVGGLAAIGLSGAGLSGTTGPTPSPTGTGSIASSSTTPTSSPEVVDGIRVETVSGLLARRAEGSIGDAPVVLRGYWSGTFIPHSCAASASTPGDLEIYCHDGEFGITELDEPILVLTADHYAIPAAGPALTPFFTDDQFGRLINADINGQPFPPVPIVVRGHFDDPRADECRAAERQRCRDRLVVDEIVEFEPGAVPTPALTPSPSPFPYDSPPAPMFEASDCAGDIAYSFIGWQPLHSLLPDHGPDEVVFAMVTRDVIEIGGRIRDPAGSGQHFRTMGRRVCYAYEWDDAGMGFGWVPGSAYREWDGGHTTPLTP